MLLYAGRGGLEWCDPHTSPVACSNFPNTWRSWEWVSCRYTPNSTFFASSLWDLCCSSERGGEPASLGSTCIFLATFYRVTCSGRLSCSPYPCSLISMQVVWERLMNVFDGCCCWGVYERTDVERRGCVVLCGVQWWEGATTTTWQWVGASPKMVRSSWSGFCSCWGWILLAFFQLLSEE